MKNRTSFVFFITTFLWIGLNFYFFKVLYNLNSFIVSGFTIVGFLFLLIFFVFVNHYEKVLNVLEKLVYYYIRIDLHNVISTQWESYQYLLDKYLGLAHRESEKSKLFSIFSRVSLFIKEEEYQMTANGIEEFYEGLNDGFCRGWNRNNLLKKMLEMVIIFEDLALTAANTDFYVRPFCLRIDVFFKQIFSLRKKLDYSLEKILKCKEEIQDLIGLCESCGDLDGC